MPNKKSAINTKLPTYLLYWLSYQYFRYTLLPDNIHPFVTSSVLYETIKFCYFVENV